MYALRRFCCLAAALPFFAAAACGGDPSHDGASGGTDTSGSSTKSDDAADEQTTKKTDAGGSSRGGQARVDAGTPSSTGVRDAGARPMSMVTSDAGSTGASCSATSSDLTGCPCNVDEKHACYTGSKATRNVGTCRDGTQTCVGNGEFGGAYESCKGEVLPTATASCVIVPDAGTPPSKCMQTSGISGTVTLPNGTMFCEDDMGGLGGWFGKP